MKELGQFHSADARERFLAAYDRAFAMWPTPWEAMDVETSYATTHVRVHGVPDGEPVVLLHGADSNACQWYEQVGVLGERYRVFAVDAPGHPGRSVQRKPVHDPADSAAWLRETLAALGLTRVHLVGQSYGG